MTRIATSAVLVCACLVGACASGETQYVGTARMLADLSIEQQVVERGARGSIGEARIVLKPGDPAYRETLERVGGLRPGEMKAMPAGSAS